MINDAHHHTGKLVADVAQEGPMAVKSLAAPDSGSSRSVFSSEGLRAFARALGAAEARRLFRIQQEKDGLRLEFPWLVWVFSLMLMALWLLLSQDHAR